MEVRARAESKVKTVHLLRSLCRGGTLGARCAVKVARV